MKVLAFADIPSSAHSALVFCKWLASASTDANEFVACHVVDQATESLLGNSLGGRSDILDKARGLVEDAVSAVGGVWSQTVVTAASTGLEGVLENCKELGADLLVLGRHASRGPDFHRLGKTVRNLLHEPPAPVAVVPTNWAGPPAGSSGVLVMARPDDPPHAVEFGRRLAGQLETGLYVRHAAPDPAATVEYYFTTPVLKSMQRDRRETSTAALERWASERGVESQDVGVELGTPLEIGEHLVETMKPALVVANHIRRHHLAFGTAAELASRLAAPVVVVPTH